MPQHETQFIVDGDMSKICDLAVQYFTGKGFSLQSMSKPTQVVFKKAGTRWTFDIRKVPQTLYITLISEPDGKVKVNFLFNITVSGYISAGEIAKLEADVMGFKNMLLSMLPQI